MIALKALVGVVLFPLVILAIPIYGLAWTGLRAWGIITGDNGPLERLEELGERL